MAARETHVELMLVQSSYSRVSIPGLVSVLQLSLNVGPVFPKGLQHVKVGFEMSLDS